MKELKLIIAGGRDFNDASLMARELNKLCDNTNEGSGIYSGYDISVVSGMARGADALGHVLGKHSGMIVYEFPADWDRYGKRAGFLRNEAMARFADVLVAFWDGQSRGTSHMIETMQRLGKRTHVIRY